MQYNRRIQDLAKKYEQFFSDPTVGQILATICPYTYPMDYGAYGLKSKRLDAWDFDTQMKEYAEYTVAQHNAFLSHTKDLDNDYVPAVNMNFGYGVHSAYFTGAPVIFGEETSWTRPYLTDWEMLEGLKPDKNNAWFQKIFEGYRYLRELCGEDCAISAFCNAGPGDMANAIRGDNLFTDLYDEPENVHALMDKCVDAAIWLEEAIHSITGDVLGGQVTANVWFPGRAPYLSEDFNDLCSPKQYAEFGAKHTERFLAHYKGAYIHHHAKGAHIHAQIAKLPYVKLLEQSLDPNCPRPVDRLPALFEENAGLPLMIRCHARDIYEHIDELKLGRVVIMLNIDTLDEGREVMRFIRKHSII
jgi:Uroporphyrinogen-III decarboxylase